MTQNEMIEWLRDMAEGPMAHNPEHADTCNALTAIRVELECLAAIVKTLPRDGENRPVPPLTRLWFVHPELNQVWPTSSPRINPVVATVRSLDDADDSYEIEYADCYQSSEAAEAARAAGGGA